MPPFTASRFVASLVPIVIIVLSGCASSPPPTANEAAAPAASSSRKADTATLRKCCVALAASADALTPPKAMYAGAAADRCKKDVETVQTEQDQDHLIATIRGELRGTPMPKDCD